MLRSSASRLCTAASASRAAPHVDGARALRRDAVPDGGLGSCDTGLRPLLARLDAASAEEFCAELAQRLSSLYPPQDGLTLFPMPRLFFVATRSAASR